MRAKVIFDDGYKIELIRPIREYPFNQGETVDIELMDNDKDLVKVFDSMIDDETKRRIFEEFNATLQATKSRSKAG